MRLKTTAAGITTILLAATATADWQTIDLDQLGHGRVLDASVLGPAKVDAVNFHHPKSRLVAFDTRQRGTRDPDLEGPDGETGSWSKGNVDAGEVAGTVLIVQETGPTFAGYLNDDATIVAQPDDEERYQGGRHPGAGEISLKFDQEVLAFRFTLFDVEQNEAFEDQTSAFVVFYSGEQSVKIAFAELIDPDSAYYDPSVQFGDHSANRFPTVFADELGLPGIDKVVINFGGSGAVGGLSYLDEQPDEVGFAFIAVDDDGIFGKGFAASSDYASEMTGFGGSPNSGGGPKPKPRPRGGGDPFTPTGVPTPGAAIAGMLLMSLLVARRPSRSHG